MNIRLVGTLNRVVDATTIELRVHNPRLHGTFLGPVPEGGRTERVRVEGVLDIARQGEIQSVDTPEALEMLLKDRRLFCSIRRFDGEGRAVAHVLTLSYMEASDVPSFLVSK
jgi:hypothetical protein